MDIKFETPGRGLTLPGTVVVAEFEGDKIRVMRPEERFHHREDNTNPQCTQCGQFAWPWLPSKDRWDVNAKRCVVEG